MTWLWAANAVAAMLLPLALVCLNGGLIERLVGLGLAGLLAAFVLVLFGEARHQPALLDVALVLAGLTLGVSLVFTRIVEGSS